jgi:hypothetical protein
MREWTLYANERCKCRTRNTTDQSNNTPTVRAMGIRPTIFNQNKEIIMKKILYKILGLLAILALIIAFFIDSIGKYYAQDYAQNLFKTPVEISQLLTSKYFILMRFT